MCRYSARIRITNLTDMGPASWQVERRFVVMCAYFVVKSNYRINLETLF